MSRLDQHIDAVRTRFLVQKLLANLAWSLLIAAGVLLLAVLVTRFFALPLPPKVLLWGGAGLLVLGLSLLMAIVTSPSREATAVRIDEILGLKERFSTAVLSRNSQDEFAQAAVGDAEKTADSVSIRKRFPLQFPAMGAWALGAVAALLVVDRYLPQMDLFGLEEKARVAQTQEREREAAREAAKRALDAVAEVNRIPNIAGREKALETRQRELETLLSQPIKDPTEVARRAQAAMQDAQAITEKVRDAQAMADAKEQQEFLKSLAGNQSAGSLSEAKQAMAEGKFDKAANKMADAINEFQNGDAEKQEKMAKDMAELANQLNKIAADPQLQQKIQQQLQKQGATQEQAQRIMEEMQKAAQGDKDAAERAKDMMQNVARNANGGVLPTPKQLEKLMDQMQSMQGQLNMQQNTQQMAKAAQQMANAMQKQAGQKGQQQQQAKGGQKGQNPGGNPQQDQNQQGGDQGDSGEQEMADAQQAMQDAMEQMEGNGQEPGQGMGEGEGEGEGEGQANQGGQGKGGKGQGNGPAGWNNGGQAAGARPDAQATPYTVKREKSPGVMDAKGKRLAVNFVKADSIKGESKAQLKEAMLSNEKDSTDDIEQDAVPGAAKEVVKKYFGSMQDDVK